VDPARIFNTVSPALAFQYVSENPPDLRNAHKTSSRNCDPYPNVPFSRKAKMASMKRKIIEDTQCNDGYYVLSGSLKATPLKSFSKKKRTIFLSLKERSGFWFQYKRHRSGTMASEVGIYLIQRRWHYVQIWDEKFKKFH
jgi:hypothetical protein